MKLKTTSDVKSALDGPVFTVFTGFKKSGEINYEQIEKYLTHLYKSNVRNFYVMPYNSRYSQLRELEIFEINKFVINTVKGLNKKNFVIVSDCIHGPTTLSADYGYDAFNNGADMFASIVREKYFSDEQVLKHYAYLSENLNMPLLVHEMPFLSGYDASIFKWPVSLLKELKNIENVLAIKEDAKNVSYGTEVIKILEPEVKVVFAGKKRYIAELHKFGLTSYLNGTSIINPKIAMLFWESLKNNDESQLKYILEKIEDPFWDNLVSNFGWHRSNKALLEAAGLMDRYDRLPMVHLDEKDFQTVKEFFKTHEQYFLNPLES
jgi:4-hydroxy-tetrahydrodipicolinate synthase